MFCSSVFSISLDYNTSWRLWIRHFFWISSLLSFYNSLNYIFFLGPSTKFQLWENKFPINCYFKGSLASSSSCDLGIGYLSDDSIAKFPIPRCVTSPSTILDVHLYSGFLSKWSLHLYRVSVGHLQWFWNPIYNGFEIVTFLSRITLL